MLSVVMQALGQVESFRRSEQGYVRSEELSFAVRSTHILHVSRLTVKEKQQRISGSFEFGSGFFSEQLVKMAFWVVSKAIAPNFSQYDTNEGSAMISCRAMLP